ncbi:LuxR C-terminal-related transcriptional regulator [Streptomyces sp. NBC_00878]|uniref:LuxR C-terminal-related transcriptional regulator n=1 Tax=Streptomyces sp. NBC_00878 TaxID=2975854 RepID=UPI002253D197|nr:LuxR C-terminal-related transcriptional regulator [Streptomyces sp. NBC_00878]MCX4903169.1 LuxR C-terminal-related transcriptional regulator [Streptomyces sp. NBC_00878]
MNPNPPPPTAEDRQISRALTDLLKATGVDLAFGGVVSDGRQVKITKRVGSARGMPNGLTVGFGLGLGGKALALRRPLMVNDYVATSGISHQYDRVVAAEGLRAMVAAPVVVNRTVRAVLYGAIRQAVPLGERTVGALTDTIRHLEQSLAVQDEVTRCLARLENELVPPDGADPTTSPRVETVRGAYAELRILAQQVTDIDVHDQVGAVCEKLAAAIGGFSPFSSAPALSSRELDVLSCVALGWTNSDIAAQLGLRIETVKSYLRSAMHRLGCHSRLDAVVTARGLGLLP